jgi:hypothetical protein
VPASDRNSAIIATISAGDGTGTHRRLGRRSDVSMVLNPSLVD